MVGFEHVFLHATLCAKIARAPESTMVAMHVTFTDHAGDVAIDRVVRFARGEDPRAVVEVDVPHGEYRVALETPKYGCSASNYVVLLADRSRSVDETLAETPAAPEAQVLIDGTAPISFLYVKPTFVVFDKGVTCDGPIAPVVPARVDVAYDTGAYYVRMFGDPTLATRVPLTVALKLRTPTGNAHYIRIPVPFPPQTIGWPNTVHLDVSEDMIDGVATDRTDTLLCPRLWETSVKG